MTEEHGLEEAFRKMVGVEFVAIGKLMAALMKHLGLKDGDFLVDVGCGSGRLAITLGKEGPDIRYHGADIVPELLEYARAHTPSHFRYTLVDGLAIPEKNESADFVTFFSVFTHLFLHEVFIYLREAKRVVKPGGRIVLSFYDPSNPAHWKMFTDTVEAARANMLVHLNSFVEEKTFVTMASHLGLEVEHLFADGTPFIPLDEPVVFTDGRVARDKWLIGQSVIVLRAPA
jgi:ubiquinone/menaquinone biosynthesis C-methylase UbiE